MDVVLYTLISNPQLSSPLLDSGSNLATVTSIGEDTTKVTSKDIKKDRKRSRDSDTTNPRATVGKIEDSD